MPNPKVFIASPLFNEPQIEIIKQIEQLLTDNEFPFYSARLHSGSDKLTAEQKRSLVNWDPVFESNVQGLDECTVMIAVLEYALPHREYPAHIAMGLLDSPQEEPFGSGTSFTPIELPDAGTVWEMGYHKAQNKIVIGFHQDKAKHLNLMLSHGCDAMIKGFDNLALFLAGPEGPHTTLIPKSVTSMLQKCVDNRWHEKHVELSETSGRFNWTASEAFDAKNKEVE